MELWRARFTVAARLLRQNYDVSPAAAATLLSYVPGDEPSEARWEKIRSAILGRDPDAREDPDDPKSADDTPSGSGSPSS